MKKPKCVANCLKRTKKIFFLKNKKKNLANFGQILPNFEKLFFRNKIANGKLEGVSNILVKKSYKNIKK